jgi:hypothetical protein
MIENDYLSTGITEEEGRKSGESFESLFKDLKDKEEIEKAEKLFVLNTIKLKTGGGSERVERQIDRSGNITGAKDVFVETFIVPPGYSATTFSSSVEPRGSAGGSANWVNTDPNDAQITIRLWADAFSKVTVKVYDVLAVKK